MAKAFRRALLALGCVCPILSQANAAITNTAIATATYNGNPVQSLPATVSVPVAPAVGELTVAKSAVTNDGGDGTDDPGDTISYTFTVTNSGIVSLSNIVLSDPRVTLSAPILTDNGTSGDSSDGVISAGWDVLGPEDTLTYTATYILLASDVETGRVINTATATATSSTGSPVTGSDTETTPLDVVSTLSIAKTATVNDGGDGVINAGDTISYSFNVTNTGTITQNNVSVSDPLLNFAGLPGRAQAYQMMAAAASGADMMTTASTSPAAPFDPVAAFEGEVHLYAPVATAKAALIWPGREAPSVAVALHTERKLVMLTGDPGAPKVGDLLGIYFELVNAGEGPLTNITVEQQGAEAFGGALDILPANSKDAASIIFSRPLTEEDIASGLISQPAIIRARSRDRVYSFAAVDDLPLAAISGMEELATASISPASVASLAPGASTTFTATMTLSQADIDAGVVNNTAEVTSTNALGAATSATGSASTPIPAVPGIALIKEGTVDPGPDGVANVNDIINFTFTVRNTGNVTLSGITLADLMPDVNVAGGSIATLAPNAVDSTTFTATYAIKLADLDAGHYDNQAMVTGIMPLGGGTVSDTSDNDSETQDEVTVISLTPAPDIALIKKLDTSVYPTSVEDVNSNGLNDAGDRIHYSFEVHNVGNVTLDNVYVQDRNASIITTPLPPTGISLAPGAIDTTSFAAIYTLTQADVDAGHFNNTADTYGTDRFGTTVTDESDPGVTTGAAPTVIDIPADPRITLLKIADPVIADTNGSSLVDVGDTVRYRFIVENTGNVTLSSVQLSDNNASISGASLGTLAPGAVITTAYIATHVITATDMTAGEVMNRARVDANPPSGPSVSDYSDPSDVTENDYTIVAIVADPQITLVKRFVALEDTDNSGTINPGDTIRYDIDVRNSGNVPLTQVTVNEQAGVTLIGGPQIALLDAGDTDTTTFSATRVLTAGDIANGNYSNAAEATGVAPDMSVVRDDSDESVFDNDAASNTDDPTVVSLLNAAVAVRKTVDYIEDVNNNSIDDEPDIIHYAFVVTNIGNSPLTNVQLTDPNATVAPAAPLNLAMGQVSTGHFTATHVITIADLVAGAVSNTAHATADSAFGPVEDFSHPSNNFADGPTVTPLTPAPAIALVKQVSGTVDSNANGLTDSGDTINYTFTIYNTGNTQLLNATVTDLMPGVTLVNNPAAPIDPGGQATVTGTYVVTDWDADAGIVSNTARVDAAGGVSDLSDNDTPSSVASDPTVTTIISPPVVLTKTVAKSEIRRGERVSYTITASSLRAGPYDIKDIMPPGFDFVNGSATVNGIAATPTETGNVLTFASITPVAGRIEVKLQLLSSVTLNTGSYINRAEVLFSANGNLLAKAQVPVLIKEEHVFDCGEIIGRVFDDLNANGYADEGEPGLPGVRVVTVKGTLITTDKHGLFHVPCADVPDAMIGSNFLMKLDTRTLPAGYRLTTENPRDVRLTRGKLTKLNFGAAKNRDLELELRRDAFLGDTVDLKDEWLTGVDRLVGLLEQGRGSLNIVYRCGQFAPVANDRVQVVKDLVAQRWQESGHQKPLRISTRVECGQ
jgi:uncharacterized repeat protein (TIGR01451 family)